MLCTEVSILIELSNLGEAWNNERLALCKTRHSNLIVWIRQNSTYVIDLARPSSYKAILIFVFAKISKANANAI